MKLSVEGLNSYYGPAHILFDVALGVGDGEVVALLGRKPRPHLVEPHPVSAGIPNRGAAGHAFRAVRRHELSGQLNPLSMALAGVRRRGGGHAPGTKCSGSSGDDRQWWSGNQ